MNTDNNKYEVNNNLNNQVEESDIDWIDIFRKLYARKWLFVISAILTIVIVTPLALTVPKFYTVEVKLAPELSSGKSGGSLSSLMSSFGLGGMSSSSGNDAIGPLLYPDLMNSKTFLVSLFDIPVQTKDGKVKATYFDYLSKYQKAPIWAEAMKGLFSLLPVDSTDIPKDSKAVKASALTKKQSRVAKAISTNVTCSVDNKTGVITIDVKDQDPVICAAVADSTCKRLQEFITEYRSKKARKEMLDVERQYKQAKAAYEVAKEKVAGYNDSNWDLVEEDFVVEKQDLQNQMQLAFQTMSAFNTQLMQARSKYQSSLPVYTVLNGASVPNMPAGPKRSMYLLVALFLVLGCEGVWVLYKDDIKSKLAAVKGASGETSKEA